MRKKIILFGGSFDPIHNGHLKVAQTALDALNADRVIFVLSKNPQYKKVSDMENRLNMLKLAIRGREKFFIDEYELTCDEQYTYSINTVKHFLQVFPKEEYELFFLIGFDEVNFLNKWHEIDELAKLIQFVAVARPGYPKNHELLQKYHVEVLSDMNYNLSSTSIREFLSFDMPKPVIDYLIEHELYFVKTIKPYYDSQRYKHAISVANLAYDIALANGKDPCAAYLAGYLHDIGKTSTDKELENITNAKFGKYFKGNVVPDTVMHQFTGALILENYFHLQDKMIIEAVRYHTTGKKHMGWLAKIIYAADKLDPLRPYDSSDMIRRMKSDYKSGFVYVLSENKKIIEKMHPGAIEDNELSLQCFNYYLKGE
jgi:nicotinate-nucleotide adenylyltransferase